MYYVILTYNTEGSNVSELDTVACVGVYQSKKDAEEAMYSIALANYPEEEAFAIDKHPQDNSLKVWCYSEFVAKYWIQTVR